MTMVPAAVHSRSTAGTGTTATSTMIMIRVCRTRRAPWGVPRRFGKAEIVHLVPVCYGRTPVPVYAG
jgi:hypothetical protein